jgi:hypothetical protein
MRGNGKLDTAGAGKYEQGDRVGVLLKLDDGSLRFFKNGTPHGPGYRGYGAGNVTGPVVAVVQMYYETDSVRLLPNAHSRSKPLPEALLASRYLSIMLCLMVGSLARLLSQIATKQQ